MSELVNEGGASRRTFLKAGAIAGAGIAAGLPSFAGAFAAGNETIKVGLVGCGGRGTGAARDALSTAGDVKLVAMADAFEYRIQGAHREITNAMAEANKPERVAVDPANMFVGLDAYQKLLATDIDLVILATPPGFRPAQFEAAVAAGKHVFMEKPVAVDGPGVRQVLEAAAKAKEKNLAVGTGLQRHHQNNYLETIKRLQGGEIGEIHTAHVYWNMSDLWTRERQMGMTEMEYQIHNWYHFLWLSGDHICEQHIHNLDVINWLKGAYPVTAQGMGGQQVRKGPKYGEIFDHHAVEYRYADGTRMYSFCRQISGCWDSVSEHVRGTKGEADIAAGVIKAGGQTWQYRGKHNNPYQTEHDNLFAAIRAGKPFNEAEFGALSSLTAVMGRMATHGGKEVTFDAALNSKRSLGPKELSFAAAPPVLPLADGSYPVSVPGSTDVL
jgi:predicted dehydrogenase